MRTIFWKEWRENWKWAVLAMLALGAAEFYGLLARSNSYIDIDGPLKPTVLLATTFGSASIGLILGLLQFMPELRRDRWALLLHRPAPRTALFWGKIGAGFLLYFLAVLPPFLAVCFYSAQPGHFAYPFLPGMMNAGLADAAAGVPYYCAGVFLALERRWAVRILGLLAAVYVSRFATYNVNLRVNLEACAAMGIALLWAAWGLMGEKPRSGWARLTLYAVLFYGVSCLGLFLIPTVQRFWEPERHESRFQVTEDGQPVRITSSNRHRETLEDLQGKPLRDPRFQGINRFQHLLFFQDVSFFIDESHGQTIYGFSNYRQPNMYAIRVGYISEEPWFYVPSKRLMLGFDGFSHRLNAVADENGFHGLETAPAPLSAPAHFNRWGNQSPFLIESGGAVNAFEVYKHQFAAFPTPPGDAVFGFKIFGNRFSVDDPMHLAIAYKNRLRIEALYQNKPPIFLPYHRDVSRWGHIEIAANSAYNRFYLLYQPSSWLRLRDLSKLPYFIQYLDEMDDQGRLLHSYELHTELPDFQYEPLLGKLLYAPSSPAFFLGRAVYNSIGAFVFHSKNDLDDLEQEFVDGRKHTVGFACRIAIASVLFSAIAFFWARRRHFSLSRARGWALFVLAFNLGGLIVFRLAADWPVEVGCPACGRKRPVDREACPHCHAGWPAPARDGTEIFDSVSG